MVTKESLVSYGNSIFRNSSFFSFEFNYICATYLREHYRLVAMTMYIRVEAPRSRDPQRIHGAMMGLTNIPQELERPLNESTYSTWTAEL